MYQLRHTEFGLYQGHCMGLGFWHPTSEMPEQGICSFPTYAELEEYVEFLENDTPHPEDYRGKLTAEPFDQQLNDTMITEARLSGII